jgi:hypothetical protein
MSKADNPFESPAYVPPNAPAYPSAPQPASGMAIGALVVGIISIVIALPGCCCTPIWLLSGMLGLVGVILGYLGMQECNRGEKSGKGMAMAGLICGGIGLAISLLFFVLMMLGVVANVAGNAMQNNNF